MTCEQRNAPKTLVPTMGRFRILMAAAVIPLLSCSDQATSPTAVLGGYASSVPVTVTIAKDSSRPLVDSVTATVRQSNRVHRVAAQAFVEGKALGLDSVALDAPFSVSLTGFESSGGARVARWWAGGGDTLQYTDVVSALTLAAVKGPVLDSLPHVDSLKVGVTFPATKGLWISSDSSDPRTSRTAKPVAAALALGKAQLYKFALRADSVPAIDKPALWSTVKTLVLRQNTPVPAFSLATGSFSLRKRLSLSDSVDKAVILWSTDSLHWTPFKDSIAIDSSMKVFARAVAPGMDTSHTTVASYELRVGAVHLDLASGSFGKEQVVHLSDSTPGVEFHCSSDSSTWSGCKDSVALTQSGKLYVYASRSGWANSPVASATYEFKLAAPTLSLASGSFTSEQAVTFAHPAVGVKFRCSFDSATWSDCDTAKITKSGKLFVQATRSGWTASPAVSASYTLTVLAPTFAIGSGVYDTTKAVGALATTPGSSIEVSRDSLTWAPMLAAVVVDKPTSLFLRALREGWTTSPVVKATYGFSDTSTALKSLNVDVGALSPAFDSAVLAYSDTIADSVISLNLTALAGAKCDTILVGTTAMTAGSAVVSVPRDTTLEIRVVNPRNGKRSTYLLTVVHKLPELSGLSLDKGRLLAPFGSTASSFTDSISVGMDTVKLILKGRGILKVNGTEVASGVPVAMATALKVNSIVDSSATTGKKRIYILRFGVSSWNVGIQYDSVQLSGRSYRTVVVGTQTWMAENLADSGISSKGLCYGDERAKCDTMGRYYTWTDAMGGAASSSLTPSGVKGVCPTGWHIPSQDEADLMLAAVGATSWNALRASLLWSASGTDASGFRLLPSGGIYPTSSDWGTEGYFWTSTEGAAGKAYAVQAKAGVIAAVSLDQGTAYPVRCVKD